MQNLNLIKKIAWSFHNTTGMEWDDLFQEAALAYHEALENYDPGHPRQAKLITYTWHCIESRLKNFVKEQNKWNDRTCSIENVDPNMAIPSNGHLEKLSKEAREIVRVIFSDPCKYSTVSPRLAKKEIARQMIEENHWSWHRVLVGIRDLKLAFSD